MRDDVRTSAPVSEPPVGTQTRTPAAVLALPSAAALARYSDAHPAARAAAIRNLQGACGNRDLARLARGRVLARETEAEKWAKAGPFGDEIYKLLAEQLTAKEMGSLLESLPDKAGEAAEGIESKEVGLTGKESAKLAKGTAEWATKAATKWLKTPSGQAFLNGARSHLGNNADFYYAVLMNLAINAVQNGYALYMAGKLDPPNLEKSLKLGGAEVTAGIDLGKKGDPVQGATAGVSFGGYGATYKYGFDPAKGATHTATAKAEVVKKALVLTASATIKTQGSDSVSLGAAGKIGNFDYSVGGTYGLDEQELTKLTVHLGYTSKDETLKWLADFAYEASDKGSNLTAKAQLTKVLKGYAFQIEANGSLKEGAPAASLIASVRFSLPHDFTIVPQIGLGFQGSASGPASGPMLPPSAFTVTPAIGVGHKDWKVLPTVGAAIGGSGTVVPVIGVGGSF